MVTVETTSGLLEGFVEAGNYCFLSVPYAAPVTDRNRFLAPERRTPWAGVRSALHLGPVCPQVPTYGPVGTTATSALLSGSDFLTLNIRSPSLEGRAPVLVWVHGGGYAVGSANEPVLQSGAFAASGIVEVTVNYRLGALGFLHVPGHPDNRGLLDQIAALEWVCDNIADFGGDPDRVTFAGRSAGGFAIPAVMAMPASHGLYARAMPQSGSSTGVATRGDAEKLTWRTCQRLGIPAQQLAQIGLGALLDVQRDLCNESYEQHNFARDGSIATLGVPFVPIIDGISMPEHPEDAALNGRTAQVPIMTGCTTAEYLTHSSILSSMMDNDDVARLMHERVLPMGLTGDEIVARYAQALPEHSPHGLWRAIGGDLVFQNPCTRFAQLHAQLAPVYKYLYGTVEVDERGSAHGAEVPMVWYRDADFNKTLPQRQHVDNAAFAREVHRVWSDFIKGVTRPDWSIYTKEDQTVLRIEAEGCRPDRDPFGDRLLLWGHSTSV